MSNEGPLRLEFQGKPVDRLELKETERARFRVSLTVIKDFTGPVRALCDDAWLTADPPEVSSGSSILITIDAREWQAAGDYTSQIRFSSGHDEAPEHCQSLTVCVHFEPRNDEEIRKPGGRKADEARHECPDETMEYCCSKCGAPLPDRRPFCASCRKEQRLSCSVPEDWPSMARGVMHSLSSSFRTAPHLWTLGALLFCLLLLIAMILRPPCSEKPVLKGTGALAITSDPPGAYVIFLDGEHPMGRTPFKASSLAAGNHKIHLQHEQCGGGDILREVMVKPNVENRYAFGLEKQGSLFVQSRPSGRKIIIDGKDTGRETPATIEGLKAGTHQITLEDALDPGRGRCYSAEVPWGGTGRLFGLCEGSGSALSLSCQEGAKVFIDGVFKGRSPLEPQMVSSGIHRVTVRAERCLPWQGTLPFVAGEIMELAVEPIKEAQLMLEGDEEGLTLFVKGKPAGALPQRIAVNPGEKLKISVYAYDGRSVSRSYTLAPGEYRREKVRLPPPPPVVQSAPAAPYSSSADSAASSAFYDFSVSRRFLSRNWKEVERLYNDVDGEGDPELLLVMENRERRSGSGFPLFLYLVKSRGGAYEMINMRGPLKGAIGTGVILSLSVLRADDLGYREVQYVCGDRQGKVCEKGSFIVYRGNPYNPSWSPNAIH